MMRISHRQTSILLSLVSSLLLLPDLIECIDGSIRDRDTFRKQSHYNGYQLRRSHQYQGCVDDLYASDLNDDLKIEEEEYVVFISTRSQGAIDVDEYSQLPFSLISNFVFGSCFCSFVLEIPNCCVGVDAAIELDPKKSPFIEDNLITICRTVDVAIINEIGTFAPTRSPTTSPSFSPTSVISKQPSGNPTIEPTNQLSLEPSGFPTIAPTRSPTTSPSFSPTSVISKQPSGNPTIEPTNQLSLEPSGFPTITDSDNPSSEPTDQLSQEPSESPITPDSEMPSSVPTNPPTRMISESPTSNPSTSPSTLAPTNITTSTPSFSPSMAIATSKPTPASLLCVNFQYGIENDKGFSADDIENEVNNTYKSGLIIATRNVTIQALNETFPRDQEGRALRHHKSNPQESYPGYAIDRIRQDGFRVTRPTSIIRLDEQDAEQGHDSSSTGILENESERWRRRAVFLPNTSQKQIDGININNNMDDNRRLAFYTDSYPPVINNIFGNPFCPDSPDGEIVCSVVDTSVCVMLEEGDDEDEIKDSLIDGISNSIQDGSFENAIPSENQIGEQIDP